MFLSCTTVPLLHIVLPQFLYIIVFLLGTAVAQWLRCCATNRQVAGSIPNSVSETFSDIKLLRSNYGSGVDSDSNRNEYLENFLGVGGRCLRLTTLTPSCAVVTKSRKFKFLEPSGSSRPVTGLLYFTVFMLHRTMRKIYIVVPQLYIILHQLPNITVFLLYLFVLLSHIILPQLLNITVFLLYKIVLLLHIVCPNRYISLCSYYI